MTTTLPAVLRTAFEHCLAGRTGKAMALCGRVLAEQPGQPGALQLLGIAAGLRGDHERAVRCLVRAARLQPGEALLDNLASACNNLGITRQRGGGFDGAAACYRAALALQPANPESCCNLGALLRERFRTAEAEQWLTRASRIAPADPLVRNNLSVVLKDQGRFAAALDEARRALAIDPGYADAHNSLGSLRRELALPEEAIATFRRATALAPEAAEFRSNLLMTCMYTRWPAARIHAEHIAAHAAPPRPAVAARGGREDRRLRVGYVSGDFRQHVASYFFEPLLAAHDRGAVEVYCYSETVDHDAVTHRLRGMADSWMDTVGFDSATLARRIAADGIDILVDLAGHSARNRLPVFALRPAPVQATWLGYPGSTGVPGIDYRLVDAVTDSEDEADAAASERLVRLAGGFLCYRPPAEAPAIEMPPCIRRRGITFGSFNVLAKLNDRTFRLWARMLDAVGDARLLLKCRPFDDPVVRDGVRARLAVCGLDPERVELRGWTRDSRGHLALYNEIDVALDSFPYNGTTTTCEALWMGVPVVTLLGGRHAARVGGSLLSRVGLDDLIALDEDDYVARAAALAGNRERLAGLRAGLRARLAASSLCDEAGFTRRVEDAYRTMWRRWRDGLPPAAFPVP